MNKVDGYGVYQRNYYDRNVQQKKEKNSAKTNGTDKAANKGNVQLSERAKKLLEQLRKTYKNMDIMVADYETDEEAAAYLSRGVKEYSVLIDPDELEEMAANEDVKKKNLDALDSAIDQLKGMKNQLSSDGQTEVTRVGITIGKDGEMSFFAELEKLGERQKEFIDNIRESKKDEVSEKSEADKTDPRHQYGQSYERGKRTTVHASTIEELLDKISNVDWDSIKEENTAPMPGGRFSSSV